MSLQGYSPPRQLIAATTERPNAALRGHWYRQKLAARKISSVVAEHGPVRARQRLAAKIDYLRESGPRAQPIAKCIQGILRAPGDHFDSAIGEIPCPHGQTEGPSPLMGGSTKTHALHAPADGAPAATLRHGITAGAAWPLWRAPRRGSRHPADPQLAPRRRAARRPTRRCP